MERHHEERFEIDGVTYESLDDVPQPHRDSIAALMADRDGDGVPDVFDGATGAHTVVHRTQSFEVNGVRYPSMDEIPEPQRSMVRDALGRDPRPPAAAAPRPAIGHEAPPPRAAIVTRAGWSGRTKLVLAMVAVDVVVAAVVLWLVLR